MNNEDLKKSRILIVDDHQANIDVLETFLMMEGYENYKSTTDPRQVLDLFGSYNPDLILLDLMMPYLNGFEVMHQLRSLISEITFLPILVLTADATSTSKQKALSEGATDFLTKPFDLVEVGLRINNLLYTKRLHETLKESNLILEDKVKERTKELQNINVELTVAKEKAEASDKLKTSFINNISHEIRTPLNGILGFGEFLAEEDLTPDERKNFLVMVNESSNRLMNTVTNFMDISMLASGTKEVFISDFKLGSVINPLIDKTRQSCNVKKLEFSSSFTDELKERSIHTDKDIVMKILQHLLENAVKFTSTGSVVFSCEELGDDLIFSVKDTGKGIEDKAKQIIFESFSQEDTSDTRGFEGTGLGLAISAGFIKLLKGEIWLESKRGEGSTFYVRIPVGVKKTVEVQSAGAEVDTSRNYVLLVAEDDDLNFEYMQHMLRGENIVTLHAKNGVEAEEICREHKEINLVLMDLKMPEMDGFEATRRIKSQRETLPVIAVTAYAGTGDREKAMVSGCDDFVTKPVNKDLLLTKLALYGIGIRH
jgi:signal transduction histidine kinase